jgi:hypothetical protein
MIEFNLNNRQLEDSINNIVSKTGFNISKNKEIVRLIRNSFKDNILRSKSSDDNTYPRLTYIGYGKSVRVRSNYRPLLPIFKYIDRCGVKLGYNAFNKRFTCKCAFRREDKPKVLIHNKGGDTYNPYARAKISHIPRRQFFYVNDLYLDKIKEEIKKHGIT